MSSLRWTVATQYAEPNLLPNVAMSHIKLNQVCRFYGSVRAVDSVSLEIRSGEFFSILGPSGCGKTTLMRLISGFDFPTHGEIEIESTNMKGIPPEKRPTALIFQNLALFPWMTVAENVAFGLRAQKIPPPEINRIVNQLLDQVDLSGMGNRAISQISGGQKQRVAIARALAVKPRALLLDEPLSALDLKLKQRMRSELKSIQRSTGLTFIYITHDQNEALALSDRIAVMNSGRIEQIGTPEEIYQKPCSGFVASFVGDINQIQVELVSMDPTHCLAEIGIPSGKFQVETGPELNPELEIRMMVRPEKVRITSDNEIYDQGHITLTGELEENVFEGSLYHALVKIPQKENPHQLWKVTSPNPISHPPGTSVNLSFSRADVMLLNDVK